MERSIPLAMAVNPKTFLTRKSTLLIEGQKTGGTKSTAPELSQDV